MMKIINFSHPITPPQVAKIRGLIGADEIEVQNVNVQIVFDRPLADQITEIVSQVKIDWQADDFIVRSAALDAATLGIIAEIHGRAGYFPGIVTFKRSENGFEPWEIVNLQAIRDTARTRR